MDGIFCSLDEAREAIRRRWRDEELKRRVIEFLGGRLLPGFGETPRSVVVKSVSSPDNGFHWFWWCSRYLGTKPQMAEMLGDKFVRTNEEKLGLSRLQLIRRDGKPGRTNLVDYGPSEGQPISSVMTKHGEPLVDFHHRLLDKAEITIERKDVNDALHAFGGPEQYYAHLMAHFICHGVLFDNFVVEGDDYGPSVKHEGEQGFTSRVVLPAIEKTRQLFGVPPLIVRLYPPQQTPEEDLWWWRYPKAINDFIVADVESKGYKIIAS